MCGTKTRGCFVTYAASEPPSSRKPSTPYARERARVEAAVSQEQMAFRIEQVITVRTARLVAKRRNFFTVLEPIFQIIRLYLKEPAKYTTILRRFSPSVFPGVLCAFARVFDVAMREMERRFRLGGDEGLDLATCERSCARPARKLLLYRRSPSSA